MMALQMMSAYSASSLMSIATAARNTARNDVATNNNTLDNADADRFNDVTFNQENVNMRDESSTVTYEDLVNSTADFQYTYNYDDTSLSWDHLVENTLRFAISQRENTRTVAPTPTMPIYYKLSDERMDRYNDSHLEERIQKCSCGIFTFTSRCEQCNPNGNVWVFPSFGVGNL